MKVSEALKLPAHPFSKEAFDELKIPEVYHLAATKAMARAGAVPVDVRRFHDEARKCDQVFVTGLGADGLTYDWGDLIKETI